MDIKETANSPNADLVMDEKYYSDVTSIFRKLMPSEYDAIGSSTTKFVIKNGKFPEKAITEAQFDITGFTQIAADSIAVIKAGYEVLRYLLLSRKTKELTKSNKDENVEEMLSPFDEEVRKSVKEAISRSAEKLPMFKDKPDLVDLYAEEIISNGK